VNEGARLRDEGYALLEAGRYDEAQQMLLQALKLSPQDPLIHYRLGLLYGDTDRVADALSAYDASIALDPGNARAHNNRGSVLQLLDRMQAAEAAFQRAHEIDPTLQQPYINLGHLLELRDTAGAIALYEKALNKGLDAGLFEHHIAALRGRDTPRADPSWVRATFDNFAPGFDRQLAALDYTVPSLLAGMLAEGQRALDIADLGCGTGQVGSALAGRGHRIVGVDLSDKMLNLARERDVYTDLVNMDIDAWLASCEAARLDIVIAADVFIYIGALEHTFAAIARALKPGGRLAFSTEECAGAYELRRSGRYAQSDDYIAQCARPWFSQTQTRQIVVRQESGNPIGGRLYVMQRHARLEDAAGR
jgi:predicted TPR repeat methyltransferase